MNLPADPCTYSERCKYERMIDELCEARIITQPNAKSARKRVREAHQRYQLQYRIGGGDQGLETVSNPSG